MIRRIAGQENTVFLTFDDGPHPIGTPRVLEVLSRHQAKATFFVITDRLAKQSRLIAQILSEGHTLGNHSPDHRYRHYFRSEVTLRRWIKCGEDQIRESVRNLAASHAFPEGAASAMASREFPQSATRSHARDTFTPLRYRSVGFRPPAGVITPNLIRAARSLDEPVILWSERFYDAVIPWTKSRAQRSALHRRSGDIILLHDAQKPNRVAPFCEVLDEYLKCLAARGLKSAALRREFLPEA